jgi:hypothetical protein
VVLHHIRVAGSGGMGMKPPDFPWGVRVCGECHDYLHNDGRGDYKSMLIALGKQMAIYKSEGVLELVESCDF